MKKPLKLRILAWIAIHWLRKSTEEDSAKLIETKNLVLSAKRVHEHRPLVGIWVVSTFTVEDRIAPDTWQRMVYHVYNSGSYECTDCKLMPAA